VSIAVLAVLTSGLVLGTPMSRAASTTAAGLEASIAKQIAKARSSLGLKAYGVDPALAELAGQRARKLADAQRLSHSLPGDLRTQLVAAGVDMTGWGEAIGYTFDPWGPDVATTLFRMWRDSSVHWGLITSRSYDRIGVGVARASNGTTYAAIVFIDSPHGSGVTSTPRATARPTPRPAPKPAATAKPTPRPSTVAPAAVPTPLLDAIERLHWASDESVARFTGDVRAVRSGLSVELVWSIIAIIAETVRTVIDRVSAAVGTR
jgi:uncharacterized protein YkwD